MPTPNLDGMSIFTVPALVSFSELDMLNEVAVKSVTVFDMCKVPDCAPVTARSASTKAFVTVTPETPLRLPASVAMSADDSDTVTESPVFFVPDELNVMATSPASTALAEPDVISQW